MWTFPAALVLPAGYAAAVIAAIHGHMVLIGYRQKTVRPHRVVFSAATSITGAFAVAAFHHVLGGSLLAGGPSVAATAIAALLAYTLASLAVLMIGIWLLNGAPKWRTVLPARSDFSFEAATLVLGLLTAEVITRLAWITPVTYLLVTMLHRSTMISELERAAKTDVKTGLLNPRGWQEAAAQQLLQAARLNQPAAIFVLDLDYFKKINDAHGHPAGDAVLASVAECLRSELRGYDALGRHGGEEFIAYLDTINATEAHDVAERLRHAISALKINDAMTVTASIGVATYPTHGETVEQLVAVADAAMYVAKRAGRNRVAVP